MFNEKKEEMGLPVWQSPKYLESKAKALEIINSNQYGVSEADFWILMNKTRNKDKMAYTGLIISHNGCLKINDKLEDKLKFKPECLSKNENGFNGSLIYEYCNAEQGLYEVGEVSSSNCQNDYPYAMAFKRCFDRVVLKNSKLAYYGVYSDAEAEEFKEKIEVPEIKINVSENLQKELKGVGGTLELTAQYYNTTVEELTDAQVEEIIKLKKEKIKKTLIDNKGEVDV